MALERSILKELHKGIGGPAMKEKLQVGDKKIFNRATFLHNGVFVLQGSTVEIKSIRFDNITIEWYDKEGNPHLLDGVAPEELL